MGSYTFKWEHPANEVFVTGTFDDWAKSVRLDRNSNGVFTKSVNLPNAEEKILYKFVVDGNWTTSHTHPIETDEHNNQNNVLHPSEIAKHQPRQPATETASHAAQQTTAAAQNAASNIAQGSQVAASEIASNFSAAKMAGQERSGGYGGSSDIPGAFPETPANELSSFTTPAQERSEFSVNPIPASEGHGNPFSLRPGEKVPDFNTADVNRNVYDDPELKAQDEQMNQQTFGVAPLPATGGAGNPVHLQPGEKVPHHSQFTANTTTSNVRLDKDSYERSDAGVPFLPPVVTPENERDAKGGMFGLPGITGTMIPESSLPMGEGASSSVDKDLGPHIQSAHPQSSTAALAAQVPKEPRVPSAAPGVPEVVADSQKEARVYPEAAANPEAVHEKQALEDELLRKIHREPAASDTRVPEVVTDSQRAAHAAPEATASPIAVAEKREVEEELLSKISTQPATSGETTIAGTVSQGASVAKDTALQGASVAGGLLASAGATIASYATTAKDKALETKDQAVESYQSGALTENLPDTNTVKSRLPDTGAATSYLPSSVQDAINRMNTTGVKPESTTTGLAGDVPTEPRGMHVPEVVSDSIAEAHASPEAAANPEALDEKSAVERELLSSIPTTNETGEPAPKLEKGAVTGSSGVTSSAVPDVVAESIQAAHASPEAAANTEAVVEKKELERELLSSIPPATEGGEPAPTLAPALSATAPGDKPIVPESVGLSSNSLVDNEPLKSSSEVGLAQPTETFTRSYPPTESHQPTESYQPTESHRPTGSYQPTQSYQSTETPSTSYQPTESYSTSTQPIETPTASTQPAGEVEVIPYGQTPFAPAGTAISTETAPTSTSATTSGLNQPTEAPAQSAATEIGQLSAQTPSESRDVSPMSRPATTNQTQPMVTTGLTTDATAASSSAAPVTPSKSPAKPADTPGSTRTSMSAASENGGKSDKKNKRRSFFGKIKDKFGSNH